MQRTVYFCQFSLECLDLRFGKAHLQRCLIPGLVIVRNRHELLRSLEDVIFFPYLLVQSCPTGVKLRAQSLYITDRALYERDTHRQRVCTCVSKHNTKAL